MVIKAKSETPIKPLRNVTHYEKWQVPSIHSNGSSNFRQEKEEETKSEQMISAEELQKVKDQAYTEGFKKGRREGLASAANEIENKTKLLNSLIEQLAEPVAQCGEQTQRQLLELAFAVSRQIVRRELKQDPTQLIAIIRDALSLLPVGAKNIRIFLHPDDASIVREVLSIDKTSPDSAWQLVEQPSMERGGCLLESDNSKVDASVDRQIAVLFSSVAGGQRTGESTLTPSKVSLAPTAELENQTQQPADKKPAQKPSVLDKPTQDSPARKPADKGEPDANG